MQKPGPFHLYTTQAPKRSPQQFRLPVSVMPTFCLGNQSEGCPRKRHELVEQFRSRRSYWVEWVKQWSVKKKWTSSCKPVRVWYSNWRSTLSPWYYPLNIDRAEITGWHGNGKGLSLHGYAVICEDQTSVFKRANKVPERSCPSRCYAYYTVIPRMYWNFDERLSIGIVCCCSLWRPYRYFQ